ncbi:sarcolemmal membrane-associated protein [Lucilia sericata]|uniref:sarcolemmal membrane-associated protein n=1 Tax=Lucilia sericata TaxID=13632 RepID=UPI0018A85922|nr:sarcolemmal membrane-associated protein [Lucilia sericata]XP_037820657.1 sarcolemmal membrane-associated protein [Lucilia sericata]
MVLVSNEWQNKSEDVPKTTANTTTTAGTAATTSSTAATANIAEHPLTESISATGGAIVNANSNATNSKQTETVAGDSINSITTETTVISSREIATEIAKPETTAATTATKTINKTLANDNANNEQQQKLNEIIKDKNSIEIVYNNELNEVDVDINECKIAEIGKISTAAATTKQQLKEEHNNLNESVLNYNNSIKIMAENTKESPLKEEKELEESQQQQQTALINNLNHTGNNKDLEESNSYPNSNTNTLTTAPIQTIKIQQNNQQQNIITQQQQQVPLSCPITPQALSSALQTALNATNNANNSVAAAGLQPNFLSQLALTANVASLQKPTTTIAANNNNSLTAKQLNQSFNMLDSNQINQNKSDSNLLEGTTTSNTATVPAATYDNNGLAKIVLICEGNSHPFQTRTISLTPNVECMVGRLIAKSKASENNAIFDCKVLSRKHAVIWYTPDGKFWVKDTKSSNGTFINDNKLGDEEAELHFGDIVKFGVDVLENSRKEVHGCIIACVKLYLPDGREAISIDTNAHRSQYSGEGRISYDELHRLNLYIQETSQREKVLTSKLCNIQNVLDATRKNSALCWQSMITEDQLLHRIHSLEKKLQFMEKNVPENLLRNEVLKLLDDKTSYQHTAKEALRKVYQERCDAMQMLAKMESAYTQSDNECSLLRDQIMNSKQTLQEVNTRLLRLETEYNEYKDETARLQQEAKEREEQRIVELSEKLRERELECEDLKKKISELLIKRAELLENEEQLLEKQAIEKLDAAIADMDLGDDEDSSDDDDEDDNENEDENDALAVEKSENKRNGNNAEIEAKEEDDTQSKFVINRKKSKARPHLTSIFGEQLNGVDEEQDKAELKKAKAFDATKEKTSPKRVKETTIMKWLQNSDLNKNEGSFDIFKAICNENENEDGDVDIDGHNEGESEAGILTETKLKLAKPTQMPEELFNNFTSKLKNVQKNLKQLEAEIENETETATETSAKVKPEIKEEEEQDEMDSSDEEDADEEQGACAEQEFIIKRNGKSSTSSVKQVLSKENKKYLLLKSSVNMLREAYNEIWDSVRDQEVTHQHKYNEQQPEGDKEKSPPPNIKVKTQFPTYATRPTRVASKKFDSQTAIQSSASDITESDSEVESLTLSSPIDSSHSGTVINVKTETSNDELLLQQLKEYQLQVGALNEKLQQTELEAQHTLEIMQVECDDVKLKMENLNKIIEALKNDKKALEQVITENNKNNSDSEKLETNASKPPCPEIDAQLAKELELEEDAVLNAINVTALEREEELITYKERLDQQQRENIDLRNEIALLKLKANNLTGTTKDVLLKQYLPCSFVILAIIIYFLTTYY